MRRQYTVFRLFAGNIVRMVTLSGSDGGPIHPGRHEGAGYRACVHESGWECLTVPVGFRYTYPDGFASGVSCRHSIVSACRGQSPREPTLSSQTVSDRSWKSWHGVC